ncbi:MAG TPA: four-carbon acid sugar kinase family protein, partial [Bacteroidales bacterium]
MIAVIADDFTGAAEIGGIGLRYGLNVVIETEDIQDHNADLLIIATDTRSLPASDAMKHIYRITKGLQKLEPEFIFKKIDSVLRGNITDELIAQMEASGQNKAIVIAANPVFNRIIRDGIYYIDDVPLHETFFSTDPEFPVISSSVLDIVGKDSRINIESLKPGNLLPEKGLIIGDAVNIQDLEKWASFQNTDTLFAGAAGFFEAVLLKQFKIAAPHSLNPLPFGEKTLYVLGSTYPKDIDFLKKLEENGHFLVNMPEEIFYNKN